jgi:hypothetical protein
VPEEGVESVRLRRQTGPIEPNCHDTVAQADTIRDESLPLSTAPTPSSDAVAEHLAVAIANAAAAGRWDIVERLERRLPNQPTTAVEPAPASPGGRVLRLLPGKKRP